MSIKQLPPFNLDILSLSKKDVLRLGLKEVTTPQIFQSNSRNFHPDGLFSTEIFGPVGSEERQSRFGVIRLHTKLLHPLIYKTLVQLKKQYQSIMDGSLYVTYDEKEKDFVPVSIDEGNTGYWYFIDHIQKVEFKESKSTQRSFRIKLLEKYRDKWFIDEYWLVIPAGLRDYTIDDNGKPAEDEINTYYRRVLTHANFLKTISKDKTSDTYNKVSFQLQTAINAVYEYIRINTFDGKRKFVQGKWVKRAVFDTTRNVITSLPIKIESRDDVRMVSFNETLVGLYQYCKSITPIFVHLVKKFVSTQIEETSLGARLIDPKTMKRSIYQIKVQTKDKWTTYDGIVHLLNVFSQEDNRNKPIIVEDKYLFLIYDSGDTIKVVSDPDTVPDSIDKTKLRPITYAELFYLVTFPVAGKYPVVNTRYPVANLGGTYYSKARIKTTLPDRVVTLLGDNWEKTSTVMDSYPILGNRYFNSVSPHYTHLARLGADFDGDMTSFMVLFSNEAIAEIDQLLKQRKYYMDPNGRLTYSVSTDVIETLLAYMTA